MGDIVSAGLDLFGLGPASIQANATTDAAKIAQQTAQQQLALQQRIYEENIARQQPFLQMGTNALNQLAALNKPGANVSQFVMQNPGYAFRMAEGQKALERSAAAGGGLFSGATGKALTRYGQDYGSNEFNNAYNRLASLANLGPSAAGVMSNLGTGYAGNTNALAMTNAANQGNALLSGANARASQYGTAGSALNTAMNTDWSKYFGSGSGGTGTFTDVGGLGAASNDVLTMYGI